jgi:signal transduction histidine kinase
MLNSRGARRLSTVLAVRMVAVSAAAFAVLFLFFFAKHTLDTPALRRATLQAEADEVSQALFAGANPAELHQYQLQPRPTRSARSTSAARTAASSWRRRTRNYCPTRSRTRRRLASPRTATSSRISITFERRAAGRSCGCSRSAGRRGRACSGFRWGCSALTLAMFAATRHALRPLRRIAAQAAALGTAVTTGRRLAKLPEAELPLEFGRVVAALNAMLGKLELSLEQQRQFTADAAHELRTPLAVLTLEIEQLPRDAVTARLTEEIGGLSRLVNQLLRFAQAEEAMAGERHPVDVAAVARRVCEDLAPVALRRQQEIAFDAPGSPVFASGQPDLIESALRNIVDNGLRHAPPRSSVVVTVQAGPRVLVEDSGPGVPDAQKEKIFERFWRADLSQPTGAGIGLALVRRIAQLHGGDVHVEDRPGGGARFVLTMEPWMAG